MNIYRIYGKNIDTSDKLSSFSTSPSFATGHMLSRRRAGPGCRRVSWLLVLIDPDAVGRGSGHWEMVTKILVIISCNTYLNGYVTYLTMVS